MGQAKRRGTFEERKRQAIERNETFRMDLARAQGSAAPARLTRRQSRVVGMLVGLQGLTGLYRAFGLENPKDREGSQS